MKVHPAAIKHLEDRLGGLFDGAQPAPPDPAEIRESVAMLRANGWPEMTTAKLLDWREPYEPTSADEWREWRRSSVRSAINDATHIPPPRNWRRWKITRRVGGWLYLLGATGGTAYITDWSGRWVQIFRLRHKPYYVLGVRRDQWRCLLKYHHIPGETVAFGMCAKCLPCPDCRQPAPLNHDCKQAAA